MTIAQAVVLAVIQGLTEFLPVSSSGHLVLAKSLMSIQSPGALWEIALHFGTLLAVFVVFQRELRETVAGFVGGALATISGNGWRSTWRARPGFRMGCYIIIGTFPAAVAALLLRGAIEGLFSKPILSAVMIFVTGEILWLTRPYALQRAKGTIRTRDSIAIGGAQALALLPGISRSGVTISAALMRGVSREQAAKFSFLLLVPAVLGAMVFDAAKFSALPSNEIPAMLLGVAASAVTGYLALRFLLRVVRKGKLHYFAYYCWAIGIAAAVVYWARTPLLY